MATKIEPFYEALGSQLQITREQRKMTQAQLGAALTPPATRASIANIENGKQRVLVHTLAQLAECLGVGIEALLPANQPAKAPSALDVERELKKKLKLPAPELKKLTAQFANHRTGSRS